MAEYEACIFGLKAAIDLGIKSSDVFGDSALVISQIKGEWDTKHPNLVPYKEHVLTFVVPQNFPSHLSSIYSQDILRRQV